jgi:carbamoyl-phosphate synthase large subunit
LSRDVEVRTFPTVLVTGAGGAAGVGLIRALKAKGHRVAAADVDPLAAGLRLADDGAALPPYDSPSYVDELCLLADKSGATTLISTLAEEMPHLARRATELDAAGLARWLPDASVVVSCIDKWCFAELVAAAGIRAPATGLGSAGGVPGPWVVKPRFGRGSRDVHLVDEAEHLPWAIARTPDAIVQSRLYGREFTVDALVDRTGRLAGAVPRWRIETKAGISVKGETFASEEVTAGVGALLDALGLAGPANVQGFVDGDGTVSFTEVNPRFSGALALSLAAGADLVGEYLRGIVGLPVRPERLIPRAGVRMTRYYEEIFEG